MRSAALGPWPCRGLKQEVSAEQSSSREIYPNPNPNPHPNHNPNPNPNPNPSPNPNLQVRRLELRLLEGLECLGGGRG